MPGAYKLLWDFLYHDCDHAGIWIVDFEIAQQYVGKDMEIKQKSAEFLFNEDEIRIIPFDNGKKWFIPSFITFQYGKLSEKNRAHAAAIEILKKFHLLNEDLSPIDKIPKPLWQEPKGDKDMDMDKDKEQEMDMDKDFGKSENLLCPKMVKVFKSSFPNYPTNKENDYPSCLKIAYQIAESNGWQAKEVTNGKMDETIKFWEQIVHFGKGDAWFSGRSITDYHKEWQRLIQKINSANGTKSKQATGGNVNTQSAFDAIDSYYDKIGKR